MMPPTSGAAKEIEATGSFDGALNNARSIDNHDWYIFIASTTGPLAFDVAIQPEGAWVRFG